MLIKTIPVGHLETNCYIVTDENTLGCAVIDPGDESNTIMDYLEDNRLSCKAILLTHGHYDHTGAVAAVAEETGAPVWMNRRDTRKPTENDPYRYAPPEGCNFYDDGDCVDVDALHFQVIATPGHTPGGVSLVCAFHRRHAVQRLLRPRRSPRRQRKGRDAVAAQALRPPRRL